MTSTITSSWSTSTAAAPPSTPSAWPRTARGSTCRDRSEYYKGKTVTDIAWGYDGRLYLSDWGGGWQPNPNGNVFTITNTEAHEADAEIIAEVGALFQAGFAQRPQEELIDLMGHRDRRVRLAAQYEIANFDDAAGALGAVAENANAPLLQRVHAIWAMGMIARRDADVADALTWLANDPADQVRIQSIKTLADLRADEPDLYLSALTDDNAQVRFYGALGLGKIGHTPAIAPLLDLLEANADADPILRHGAVYALELINRPDDLIERAQTRGPSARLGAVLVLRRLGNIGLATFLHDEDPRVAIEAARAVYDRDIELAIPALARLLEDEIAQDRQIEPLMRRVIEANANVGDTDAARRLARFAAHAGNDDIDDTWRILAVDKLAHWHEPIRREGVWGHWVDLPARDQADARAAYISVEGRLDELAGNEDAAVLLADLRSRFAEDFTVERILEIVTDPSESNQFRASMLSRLRDEPRDVMARACQQVLDSGSVSDSLFATAMNYLAASDGEAAMLALPVAPRRRADSTQASRPRRHCDDASRQRRVHAARRVVS